MKYHHAVANLKFYPWLREDAKTQLKEDWHVQRTGSRTGTALRSALTSCVSEPS